MDRGKGNTWRKCLTHSLLGSDYVGLRYSCSPKCQSEENTSEIFGACGLQIPNALFSIGCSVRFGPAPLGLSQPPTARADYCNVTARVQCTGHAFFCFR